MKKSKIPLSLERPPIVEAVFELRFASGSIYVGDVFPGLLFEQLKGRFSAIEDLPAKALPRNMRLADPNLRFISHSKLVGDQESLLIGDHVITVSKVAPYKGWEQFQRFCRSVVDVVQNTQFAERIERISYKCINLIETSSENPLSPFDAELNFCGFPLRRPGFHLRTEITFDGFENIIEVFGDAHVKSEGQTIDGVLFSVDTYCAVSPGDFWADASGYIERAHNTEKSFFFRLLRPEVIDGYGPDWGK